MSFLTELWNTSQGMATTIKWVYENRAFISITGCIVIVFIAGVWILD